MPVPSTIRALVKTAPGKAEVQNVPPPKLRDDYILVKTTAVALNPADAYSLQLDDQAVGCRIGLDFAGVVVELGSKCTSSLKPGDRIAGMVHGGNNRQPDHGAFAEYTLAKDGILCKVPDSITDEAAATLGVGVTTVGQGLYQSLGLPLPDDTEGVRAVAGTPILIYGGSTATGVLGIQYAKLSGFRVLTTASPHNHEYLRSVGADEVYDHNSATWVDDVRAATGGKLRLAWDCIARSGTPAACARALDRDEPGAKYGAILIAGEDEVKGANPGVDGPKFTLGYTIFGETVNKIGKEWPASQEDYEFGRKFWKLTEGLLAEGKIQPMKQEVDRGGRGLEHVTVGIEALREWKVSGAKLVYHVV